MNNNFFSFSAKKVLELEYKSIKKLYDIPDVQLDSFINYLSTIKGRIIWSGIGKSALIAQKIVATMNSTGSPSFFLHATEALHGDLGMLLPNDAIILISNSGNTSEIKKLTQILLSKKHPFLAITGNSKNFLSDNALHSLCYTIDQEACQNTLAPTTSTTMQLILGDMIAIALSEHKNFTKDDFAALHPDGILGKSILLKVKHVLKKEYQPRVEVLSNLQTIISEISKNRMGATAVFDANLLVGIITDGDLRRMLLNHSDITKLLAKDIMSTNPKTINANTLAKECLRYMEAYKISQIIILENQQYLGMVHIHDLIEEGFH